MPHYAREHLPSHACYSLSPLIVTKKVLFFEVSFYGCFDVSFDVSCDVSLNVSLNVSFDVSIDVSFIVSVIVSFNVSCNVSCHVTVRMIWIVHFHGKPFVDSSRFDLCTYFYVVINVSITIRQNVNKVDPEQLKKVFNQLEYQFLDNLLQLFWIYLLYILSFQCVI